MEEPIPLVRIIARTNVGGPALQVTALMRHLPGDCYHQVLLRGQCGDDEDDYLDLVAYDVNSTSIPGLGRRVSVFGDIQALYHTIREIRRLRPVIVHTHTAKAGFIGRLAAVITRVPIRVHTFHGHVLRGYFRPGVSKVVALVERVLARSTTHIVAVGDQTLADLKRFGIAAGDRSSVIAPGVKEGRPISRGEARSTLGLGQLPPDSLVLVFVGRLTTIKRPERVIQLASYLEQSHRQVHVLIVGDGALRRELQDRAPSNVTFLGTSDDMSLVFRASDIALLTSDNEGMPVALIEAAIHGLPAVSTDAGSVRQVVIDEVSGFVVPIGDEVRLRSAVETLLDDAGLRHRMGTAAQSHARRHFSESRLVEDYLRLYDDLVERHLGP